MGALQDRIALVVGASSGLGESTALALAEAGAHVAIAARRADRLEDLAARVRAIGREALVLPGDATDESTGRRWIADTVARFERLDILVNSAGIIRPGQIARADLDEWRYVIDINLMATLYTCHAALEPMLAQGSGDIINVSSTAGRRSTGAFAPYATSKFGLNGFTEALRQQVGGRGVRVCVIEPGATTTEVTESVEDPLVRARLHEHVHKEGAMKPEDVAAAIVFVASLPPRANVSEILIRPTIDTAPL